MGKTVTKKALSDLKCRNQKFYEALERLIVELPQATWRESLEFTNEIQILIDA